MQLRTRRSASRYCMGVAIVGVTLLCATTSGLLAVPSPVAEESTQSVGVRIAQRDFTVDPDGAFHIEIAVNVTAPTEYLEARLRILNPGGRLMYQKTEIRHDVEAGETVIVYERELGDLGLSAGRYPIEVRVLATGADPTYVEDRLLVIRDDRPPLDVAVVARFACTPARDPLGRFVLDPARLRSDRDRVLEVAETAGPLQPLTLAIPPIMLEDWLQASAGYEIAGPEGVVAIEADASVPLAYAEALDRLRESVDGKTVELLDVPYAEPDLQGLETMSALDDLTEQYRLGRSIYQASLASTPVAGTAIVGDAFSTAVLGRLAQDRIQFALASQASVRSRDVTPTAGAHPTGSGPVVLLVDPAASTAIGEGRTAAFVDRLFDAAVSEGASSVLAQVWFGAGTTSSAESFERVLAEIARLPWAKLVHASSMVDGAQDAEPVHAHDDVTQGVSAPLGYWGEVLEARRLAMALRASAGEDDADAVQARRDVFLAESRCWAGPDGDWSLEDRGRSYATAAVRRGEKVLSAITVSSEDITLAGRTGKVPLSIGNESDKELTVSVTARGDHARIGPPDTVEVTLRPAENYVTLPVSMSSVLSDRLEVEVRAGDTVVATTSVGIRASYLDRLAVAGFVVLVLAVLLFYIRRRVMT